MKKLFNIIKRLFRRKRPPCPMPAGPLLWFTLALCLFTVQAFGARLFTAASSQYLASTFVPSSVEPMTIAVWFKAASTHTGSTLGLGTIAGTDRAFISVGTTPNITANYVTSGGTGSITYNVTYGTSWHHVALVVSSSTLRVLYYDGLPVGTNTTSVSSGTFTMTYVGTRVSTTPGAYFDGTMAEGAVWSVALTDAEVSALGAGGNHAAAANPREIRPDKLMQVPMRGVSNPEYSTSGTHFGLTNAPTAADHPAIRQ